ncbi:MAG: nucleoside hydrolase [Anaerolineae bacterium]
MTQPSKLSQTELATILTPGAGRPDIVLDTDTYNEIDDQFALVYALLSERVNLRAVYAAPFHNERSSGPEDGMLRSYAEIKRILGLLGREGDVPAYEGSRRWMTAAGGPLNSPAADDLARRAMAPRESRLYVLSIGAITNIASALLLHPEIAERIVVVWLGGNPPWWPDTREFNLKQDPAASRTVLDCGVPLVLLPCMLVTEQLRTTLPEMERYVKGRGAIGDYLYTTYRDYMGDAFARSKVIWDISAVAYMVNPHWMAADLRPSPVLRDDITWGPVDESRHPVCIVRHLDRDAIFGDLFRLLAEQAAR